MSSCFVLHWLDVADRIRFRLCVQVFKCQHSMAPEYLAELWRPASSVGIYDLLAVASLTFHELDCQHTEDVRSVMLDRLLGTLFLSVSRTVHCLCLLR